MGVLAGVIVGIISGILYNKFYNIKLPEFLGFFSGRRFVPIVTAATFVVLALILVLFGVLFRTLFIASVNGLLVLVLLVPLSMVY